MAGQGVWVQLEQSDMLHALNKSNMGKEGYLWTIIEDMQCRFKQPHTEVWEEKKWRIENPAHRRVMEAIEIHPGMVCENLTDGSLSAENGTANSLQTRWRWNGTGTLLTEPMPPPSRKPTEPPGKNLEGYQSQIDSVLPGYL